MPLANFYDQFDSNLMDRLLPAEKTDQFFEALFGDANEGDYDIRLAFCQGTPQTLQFEFQLTAKPGKCLACNLTQGLPNVFARHPVIDLKGIVAKIAQQLEGKVQIVEWYCGETIELAADLHIIPLILKLAHPHL